MIKMLTPQFISFEGGEGAGKSTQIRKLQDYLQLLKIRSIITREPGGNPEAEAIRELLVQGDVNRWDAKTEALLMNAARRDHVVKRIRPALEAGMWVLCDRFADSTIAYQGYGKGVDLKMLQDLHALVCGQTWPNLTFVLDIAPDLGLQRARSRQQNQLENRFENMDKTLHQRVREGFVQVARDNPDRCILINAAQEPDAVFSDIQSHIDRVYFNVA